MKYLSTTLVCILLNINLLFAQGGYKFGHVDFQQLLQSMPERDVAQKAVTKMQKDLENQLTSMQKELNDKGKDYIAQQKTMTDAVRSTREDEIQSLQQRIQNFQQQAQDNLSKEEAKQFQPIIDKARKAISDVGKEQGLLYIFEVNGLLYHSDQSTDILPLVKKKLGIK